MRAHVPAWAGLAAALLAAGCGPKATYNPFQVPRDQFYGKLHVVALAPIGVPQDLENPEPVKQKFLGMIEALLREEGFTLVPPAESQVIWDSMAAQLGGFYDPVSGKLDAEKLKTARMHLYRELRARHGIDAVLFSTIAAVEARLEKDKAVWHGTSQGAAKGSFWKALLGASHSGRIPALSLFVTLSDTDDTDLYVNAGGIEVLVKVDLKGNMVPVPRDELFTDEERNQKAVHLALDPLLGRTGKPK